MSISADDPDMRSSTEKWVRPVPHLEMLPEERIFRSVLIVSLTCLALILTTCVATLTSVLRARPSPKMDSMDSMPGMADDAMAPASSMNVFTNAHNTPLFSASWIPSSSAGYAGTCIFLILLAVVDRCLIAFKATMERRWQAEHIKRHYIAIADKPSEMDRIASMIPVHGVEESIRVIHSVSSGPVPWQPIVDVPRAGLFLLISGVSYLLMLSVMTLNVGYFCSVLAGGFIGELAVGRYAHWNGDAH